MIFREYSPSLREYNLMVAGTSKIGGGMPPEPPKPPKPAIKRVGKWLRKTGESLKVTAKATSVARAIGSIVKTSKEIKELSSKASKGLTATKGLSIASTPFNICTMVEDFTDIIKKANLKDRVRALFRLITDLDTVTDSIAGTYGILYTFQVIAKTATDWIPIYNIVSFFVGFISLGLAGEQVGKSGKLVHDLGKALKKLDTAKTDVEKAKILGDFLAELEKEGIRPLFKRLMISSKAIKYHVTLTEAPADKRSSIIKALSEVSGLSPEEAKAFAEAPPKVVTEALPKNEAKEMKKKLEAAGAKVTLEDRITVLAKKHLAKTQLGKEEVTEAEHIVRALAPRVKLELGLRTADLANRIVTMVGKGFAAFAPFLPVGYIILATTGLVSLAMIGGTCMCISKNPFDPKGPKSKSRAVELVAYISNGITHLRDRLHAISLWSQTHPAVSG